MFVEKIKESYKLKFFLSIFALIVIGGLFIVFSEMINNDFWSSVCNNIASALFITGVFGLINEYFLKDKLVELILSKLSLKESIDNTGIEMVFSNISEIDYNFFFKRAKKNIDIFHVYGRTWTNNHIDEIKEKLLQSNCRIRVIILSPDSEFIPALATAYDITPEELRARIYEVEKIWRDLFKEKQRVKKRRTQSVLELYHNKGKPFYSLYRVDDRVIQVTSKITKGKTKTLPSIVCKDTYKGSDLYDFYKNEIEEAIRQSEQVDLYKDILQKMG